MPSEFIISTRRLVTPDGVGPASVRVREGTIAAIERTALTNPGCPVIDVGDSALMAGLVDTHVHVNEPGRSDWEGFETATKAAAAGGVTTIVDMPLNSVPPTTTAGALDAKRQAARGRVWVDVGFWGGIVPGNERDLAPLVHAGVLGFKCFLVPSGVHEFPHVSEADLRAAMPIVRAAGLPLLAHAEVPGPIDAAIRLRTAAPVRHVEDRHYAAYVRSRPPEAEEQAIALLVDLTRRSGCHTHIVHLAAASTLPLLADARAAGLPITVETCPHYLFFSAEEIADGATAFKCAPPIRERRHRERLWAALDEGLIDLVASDHSPSPPEMKRLESGDFMGAWGGIASLQLALPAVWTAAEPRGAPLAKLAEWMCLAPARLAGLARRKGAIAPGRDADFVVWRPDATFRVEPDALLHRHKLTPYAGLTLAGVVEMTFVRGELVYDRGRFGEGPRGELLRPVRAE